MPDIQDAISGAVQMQATDHAAVKAMAQAAAQSADPFLQMLQQAAASGDVATMDRAFELRAREQIRNDEQEFNAAMVRVQSKIRNVAPNKQNNQTHSKYASFDALHNMVCPLYVAEGFALSFNTEDSPVEDCIRAVCYVTRGAYTRTYHVDMPCDGKGAKGNDVMTKTHARGAAISYGNRYNLKNIFAIAVGEEDMDGNDVVPTITEDEAKHLQHRITTEGVNEAVFLKACKVESLEEILACNFVHIIAKLDDRKASLSQKGEVTA